MSLWKVAVFMNFGILFLYILLHKLFIGDTSLSLIINGLPKTIKTKGIKDWFSPIKLRGVKIVRGSTEAIAFITFFQQSDVTKALQRNEHFLGGSKVRFINKIS